MREIVLWVLPNNGYETVRVIQDHLASYLREHPGIKVFAKVRTQGSLWDALFVLIKNPHQRPRPDIVQIPSHWTSTLAHLGLLQDLGELDPQLDIRRWFLPVRDNCRLEGTSSVYSLPWWMELRALYYRKEALREAGVDSASLASWDGFKSACEALAARGFKQPVVNPNPRESVAMADLAPCVWSRGGDFFSRDGSRSLFQRDDAMKGIMGYFELLDRGWMPLKGQSGPPGEDALGEGRALQFSGRFPWAGRGKAGKDMGVAPFPAFGGKSAAGLQAANLAMLKDVEAPREVYGFLKELTRGDRAADYARAIGALPAVETELKAALEECPEFCEVFKSAMGEMRTLPNLKVLGTLEKVFNRSMERLVGDVLHKDYGPEGLKRELIHAAAEIDYVLSLYG